MEGYLTKVKFHREGTMVIEINIFKETIVDLIKSMDDLAVKFSSDDYPIDYEVISIQKINYELGK